MALFIALCLFSTSLYANEFVPPEVSAQTPVVQASPSPSSQQQAPSQSLPPTLDQMDNSALQVSTSTQQIEPAKKPPTRAEALEALKKISPNLRPFVSVRFEEKIDTRGSFQKTPGEITMTGEIKDEDVKADGLLLPDFEQAKSILNTFPDKEMKPYVSVQFRFSVIFDEYGRQSESIAVMTYDPVLNEIQTKIERVRVNNPPRPPKDINEETVYEKIREKIPVDMSFRLFVDSDEGDRLTFKAEGLPEGLVLTAEGYLQGTATKPGNYVVTLTATDTWLISSTTKFRLVVEANKPPEIVKEIKPLEVIEGQFVFIDPRAHFVDLDGDRLTLSVEGLPPGMRWENGRILGIPPDLSAGDYTIKVKATDVFGASVELPINFTIKAETGAMAAVKRALAKVAEVILLKKFAQEDLNDMPMTWIEENFLNDFGQISNIPYVARGISSGGVFPHIPEGSGKDFPSPYVFNCDVFSTCTSIAAKDDYYVYQFKYRVATLEFPQGSSAPKSKVIHHALNMVWLGRTDDGKFDIYGIYEPIKGVFHHRFVLPASNKDPEEIPEEIFDEYLRRSFLINPRSTYLYDKPAIWIKNKPVLSTGNAKFYNPLYTEALFKIYLEPDLTDRILEGLKQVPIEDYNK